MTLCFEGQTVINDSKRKKFEIERVIFAGDQKSYKGIKRETVSGDQHFSSRWRKKV